jgi:hypothetical protein
MTGADFLALAARLVAASSEAEWRTGTSRAYYAAFHAARDLFESLGFRVPHADQAHHYLYVRLYNSANAALADAADDLHELRRRRNEADYDFRRAHARGMAAGLVAAADRVIQSLAAASSEPTRTQITTSMKDYERNVLRQVTWTP